ncbi:MAG: hypothetical protein GY826_04035 [Fuerstiella sp.]|nr:hypothetical protein [Fuerstiella sp.]MDG2127938.1 hypothetical protein [Fuerstiella sp.]
MKNVIQATIVVTMVVVFTMSIPALAGCHCGGGAIGCASTMPLTPYHGLGSVAAYGQYSAYWAYSRPVHQMPIHGPHPAQADGRRYPIYPCCGAAAEESSLVPLVPGTLGKTYTKTSHRIPEDKHPRLGMLAVRDTGKVKYLSVERMSGFRMDSGVWMFETDHPLVTWTENIVRIEARKDVADVEPYAVSFVRLIPGRLVYLDFK